MGDGRRQLIEVAREQLGSGVNAPGERGPSGRSAVIIQVCGSRSWTSPTGLEMERKVWRWKRFERRNSVLCKAPCLVLWGEQK